MIKYKKFDYQKHVFMGTLHAGFVYFNLIPNLGECTHRIVAEVLRHINGLPVTDDDTVLDEEPVFPDVYVNIVFAGGADSTPYVDLPRRGESLGSYEVGFNDPELLRKFEIQGMPVRALRLKVEDWQLPHGGSLKRYIGISFYQSAQGAFS